MSDSDSLEFSTGNFSFDQKLCGNLTEDYKKVWKQFEFWCEGVFFSALGIFGLVANSASIITFLSPEMRKQTFNQLLAGLAFCEIMYIVFNVPVHAHATFPVVYNCFSNSSFLSQVYVYLLYPMSAVAFCASTYMTLAVTCERYIAVCRPHHYRALSHSMTSIRRLLVYVIPVTLLSFALNIPKFIEVTLDQDNGTNEVNLSETRRDPTYIFWYTLSLIWHPTLTTGLLPFLALLYMNSQIFLTVRRTRTIFSGRESRQRLGEMSLAVTLSSIVLTHILCNALRIFLGVLVVALVEEQVACMEEFDQYIPPLWVMCLESVAHLLVMINFSTNFIIYCSVSAPFKKAFSKVFHLLQRKELREGMGRQAMEGPSCITRDISLTHIELKAIGLEPDLPLVDNLVEEVDGLVVKEVKVELNASALTRQDCKLSDTPSP